MRNTNNGQTQSDFTDFVRAVTRNRDTTWRGLTHNDDYVVTIVNIINITTIVFASMQ